MRTYDVKNIQNIYRNEEKGDGETKREVTCVRQTYTEHSGKF